MNKNNKKMNKKNDSKGFTLLEVMVVLVIVGILTTLAMPSYRRYVQQGKVVEAHSMLTTHRIKMEQSFQDNRTFVGACAAGTSTALPTSTTNFAVSCSNLDVSTYTITATGAGGAAGFVFTVNQDGAKTTSGVPNGWTASTTCWRTSPSGC